MNLVNQLEKRLNKIKSKKIYKEMIRFLKLTKGIYELDSIKKYEKEGIL